MHFIPEEIERYSLKHTTKEAELLYELNRQTHIQVLQPRMLSGHAQGRILSMISHMMRPQRVLEIGTYTGYSALCMAEGMPEGGKLITIDLNEELETFTRSFIDRSEHKDKIDFRLGNAMEIIPELDEVFDVVFIDADKSNYCNYFNLVIDKVRPGGFIIGDNVLWSGKVIEPENPKDIDTIAIKKFNKLITESDRVENVLLPIRDGLQVARVL